MALYLYDGPTLFLARSIETLAGVDPMLIPFLYGFCPGVYLVAPAAIYLGVVISLFAF